MRADDDEDKHVREVYARFGLAVYCAQVLEHGLVNALVVVDLIPTRRHLASSREEWEASVDTFMDRHFETTMGRLMKALRDLTSVPPDVEHLLRDALKRRNWLAHDFFCDRATEFMSLHGREQMLREVDACRSCFQTADQRLEEIIRPLRLKAGISDEVVERAYQRMMTSYKGDG